MFYLAVTPEEGAIMSRDNLFANAFYALLLCITAVSSAATAALCIAAASASYETRQFNWIHGPGYPGPYQYWAKAFHTGENVYWENEGHIHLQGTSEAHTVTGSESCDFLQAEDINGDGFSDIIVSNTYDAEHLWFENLKGGTSWVRHVIDTSKMGCYYSVPFDADGDGDMDVFGAIMRTPDSLMCYLNTDGQGLQWEEVYIGGMIACRHAESADMDHDGDSDIVAASFSKTDGVNWYENADGSGKEWIEHTIIEETRWGVQEISVNDLDQDGDLDVAAAHRTCDESIIVLENPGVPEVPWKLHDLYTDPKLGSEGLDTGDLDGDGDIDIAEVEFNTPGFGRVIWLENDGGPFENWEIHVLMDSFPDARGARIADITGDGYNDILASSDIVDTPDSYVYLFQNPGPSGGLWARYKLYEGHRFRDVNSADIDNDGWLDVITLDGYHSIYWLSVQGDSCGTMTSSINDMTCYHPVWQNMDWEGCELPGTDMYFQVRGSNDPDDLGEWSEMVYEPGPVAGFTDSTFSYIQYRVHMENSNNIGTPILDEVSFFFEGAEGIEEGSSSGAALLPLPSPSSLGSVSFQVAEPSDAALYVYDLSGRCVFTVSGHWQSGTQTVQLPCLPAGLYTVRLESGNFSETARAVKL
ncbi:hypothetical protein CSA37_03735 [Candidatus Fermentibacteria bacterium]|nr:MAG: hypothetical protein CSA37_03735 [Candidatus Fermentibacteria bacterium]